MRENIVLKVSHSKWRSCWNRFLAYTGPWNC